MLILARATTLKHYNFRLKLFSTVSTLWNTEHVASQLVADTYFTYKSTIIGCVRGKDRYPKNIGKMVSLVDETFC